MKTSRKPKALAPATQTATQITPQRVQRSLQARYNPIAQLTPAYLTSSLDLFAQGYLGQFARLADAIERRDDKIAACRRKRISAVARYGFEILTADVGEDKELAVTAEQHKEVLEYFYGNVTACNALDENQRGGFSLLARQMADAIGKKYAVHEIVMKPGDGAEDGGLTAELRFCPLWFFENRTGKLRFLDQDAATEGKDMSAEQWLVTVGDGIMEACAVAYLYKRLPLQDWLSYTEKFGMPGLLGKTPATPGSAEWNAMESAVGAFMNDWAAVVNQGAEISLVEASAGGGQNPFEPLIERMDRAIAILWRGADLSTMSAGNGEGQGASVQGGEGELLEQDDAAWLAETMQMQLSRLVIEYHFGKGVRPLAYIQIKTRDDGDTRLDIEVLRAAREMGIPIAVKDARERLGLVTPDEGEELLGKAEPKDGTAADAASAAKKQEEKAKQAEADALANEIFANKDYNDGPGRWVTIDDHPVFIEDSEGGGGSKSEAAGPAAEDKRYLDKDGKWTSEKPVPQTYVLQGGPHSGRAQTAYSNTRAFHVGHKGQEESYYRTDKQDAKGRTILEHRPKAAAADPRAALQEKVIKGPPIGKANSGALQWGHTPGSKLSAPVSYSGDYVITHRWTGDLAERHVLSFRPEGKHVSLGEYPSADAAKKAAEDHDNTRLIQQRKDEIKAYDAREEMRKSRTYKKDKNGAWVLAANERQPATGADSPVLGKLLAKARHSFPAALARDLQPLKAALAAVLHGDDAGLAERAAALDAKLRDPAFVESLITSAASSTALFEILSAATAQGLSTSH